MDRPLLLPLAVCTQPSLVGGKALGLARLLAGGFPVPSGFCVTTEAYDHALRAPGFSPTEQWQAALHSSGAERQRILSHCRTIILNYDIAELTAQIVEQVQRMDLPLLGLWAVRSSATNEDGVRASFAGVYCTRLGIPLEEMGLAVKDLWMSIWDETISERTFLPSNTAAAVSSHDVSIPRTIIYLNMSSDYYLRYPQSRLGI